MKLWIDDVREPPDESWTWVQNSLEAILQMVVMNPEEVSFDHDLGGDDTAMKVVDFIDEVSRFEENYMPRFKWSIHSANPVGRANIQRAMERIEEVWNGKG